MTSVLDTVLSWIPPGRLGLLLILSGLGVVYSGYMWLIAWLLIPSWRGRPARTLWLAVLSSLIVIAGSITVYEVFASRFYRDPMSAAYDTYVYWARTAFFALFGLLVLIAGGVGYVAGRFQGHHRVSTAVATLLTVALFLILTIKIVEYETSCSVGESFILDRYCD